MVMWRMFSIKTKLWRVYHNPCHQCCSECAEHPKPVDICLPGDRVTLLTPWDGTQQSPSCSQLQTPLTRVRFKLTTSVGCERLQNLLSTCRAIQSSHINAHANACFEHGFVGSTASSVFEWEQIFLAVWQNGFSIVPGSWGALGPELEGVARRDLLLLTAPPKMFVRCSTFSKWNKRSFKNAGAVMSWKEDLCF